MTEIRVVISLTLFCLSLSMAIQSAVKTAKHVYEEYLEQEVNYDKHNP